MKAVAEAVESALRAQGEPVAHLELDVIRRTLTPSPTYSETERDVVYRALVFMATALTGVGVPVIIGAKGVEKIIEVQFTAEEKAMFDKSVAAVKAMCDVAKNLKASAA